MSVPRSSAATAARDHLARELRFIFRGAARRDRVEIVRMLIHLHTRIGRLGSLFARKSPNHSREFDLKLRDGPFLRLRLDDVVAIHILR